MPLADGQVFAGYTILRTLGAGGMGEVYLARHPRLPRSDALKVLPASVSADAEYRRRFELEADHAATLWHPRIVEIHDRGEYEGQLWISMDFVEGTDAARLLADSYPHGMPPDDVIRIVTAIAEALDYAHQRQLLHRDIKPANILLANTNTEDERIMLADFGIARRIGQPSDLTGTNMTVGTVAYAAPEQLRAETVDGRADQYALAATAFQLLTGAPPFQNTNPAVVISQHLTADPPAIATRRPELSSLGPVFAKALAKSPADRFDRCIDFARALEHSFATLEREVGSDVTMKSTAAPADAGGAGPRHAKPSGTAPKTRRRMVIPAAATLAVIAVAAGAFLVWQRHDDRSATAATGSSGSSQPNADNVSLPVVVVGADCATLGEAGITETGEPAYCAHLTTADKTIWSMYPGKVPHPSGSAAPGAAPVLVCMEQTGKSQMTCHESIVEANSTSAPTS